MRDEWGEGKGREKCEWGTSERRWKEKRGYEGGEERGEGKRREKGGCGRKGKEKRE